ncbi:MAG: signal peptide peptidase SppA [Alphaproteobacteria bacterium]|nr:signal peptide peptidase SppA [Alphaproteobacteria bacterium]
MTEQKPPAPPARPSRGVGRSTMVLLGLTALLGLLFVASVGVVAWTWSSRSGGVVHDQSFLALTLSGEISDGPQPGGIFDDPGEFPPIASEIAAAVRKAKDDPRIEGIWLVMDSPSVGWAGYEEIRDALVAFREAGKPCVAYSEAWTIGPYYLASACDVVAMPPSGIALINGFSAHVTFYAGTFDKIGVQAQMLHVGDFKSAVEPYERTEPSEPASEAMNGLLDSLWGNVLDQVAAGRGVPVDQLRERIDHPTLSPRRALEAGFVDVLAYPDQLRAHLSEVKQDGWKEKLDVPFDGDDDELDDRFTKLRPYLAELRGEEDGRGAKIAVIHAEGQIMGGEGGGLFGDTSLTDRRFHEWMEEARADDAVKAVVLRVNSPGGSGLASDLMWRDIQRFRATGRPVVVSMGNYAASGGYYISAPADWIIAQPNTLTGSIGVFGGKIIFAGTYEKLGLTDHAYERGAEADLLSTLEPFSDEGRVSYQGFLDDFYATFLGRVSEGRKMETDAVHAVAQGRVWTGSQALDRKLVDELGGLDTAIAKAAELASVTDYGVERWPKRKGFFELLMEDIEKQSTVEVTLPGLDPDALQDVMSLAAILEDGPAALVPGGLRLSE